MISRVFLVSFFSPFLLIASWAEEELAKMSLDEKIGQLFVVPACPKRMDEHVADLEQLFEKYPIGNVIVKQSDPLTQVRFLNRLQELSKRPLLVCADVEWGLAMRMSDTIAFPRNMTLGAIQDLSRLVELGVEIGRQAKRVGIHLALAPVADVNNNPLNPVIHMRSFGEDPVHVAECVVALTKGLQMSGCFACAKHFPGHGDTSVDSHRDLPVINHTKERLEAVELVPFQMAVEHGVDALMTAHLYVPAIDDQLPTSLSRACLNVARERLHFQGLIISDALNMKAVADRYSPEKVAILSRMAGCDLLLYGDHIDPNVDEILRSIVPAAFNALKQAYLQKELSLEELDQTVLKILQMKEKIATHQPEEDLIASLNTDEAKSLKQTLFQEAITQIGEEDFPIPEDTAYLSFGTGDVLASLFPFTFQGSVEDASRVVIAIHQKEALLEALPWIEKTKDRSIVCLFATPYALKDFNAFKTLIVGYENDEEAQKAVLTVLLGKRKAQGKLPVSLLDLPFDHQLFDHDHQL